MRLTSSMCPVSSSNEFSISWIFYLHSLYAYWFEIYLFLNRWQQTSNRFGIEILNEFKQTIAHFVSIHNYCIICELTLDFNQKCYFWWWKRIHAYIRLWNEIQTENEINTLFSNKEIKWNTLRRTVETAAGIIFHLNHIPFRKQEEKKHTDLNPKLNKSIDLGLFVVYNLYVYYLTFLIYLWQRIINFHFDPL